MFAWHGDLQYRRFNKKRELVNELTSKGDLKNVILGT
jgi:hypothetical protein